MTDTGDLTLLFMPIVHGHQQDRTGGAFEDSPSDLAVIVAL